MRFWSIGVLLLTFACATTEATGPRSYTESAQALYEEGLGKLEAEDYEGAIVIFEQVRSRFPYSSYAALAELGVADTQFRRARYLEAIDAYEAFIRFHPTHARLDYASFRVGESHYNTIPSNFFLFPPASERDQTSVRSTRTALQAFLQRFPESQHGPRARDLLQEVLGVLARHELATAKFYARRGKWAGAAGRYRYLLRTYPGMGLDEEALTGLVESLLKLEEREEAEAVLSEYLQANPDDRNARRLLDEVRGQAKAP